MGEEDRNSEQTEEELHRQQHEDSVWKLCAFGEDSKLEPLLAAQPDLARARDDGDHLPLQWAALNARCSTITLLLGHGADARDVGAEGQTPLHWACVRGHLPTVLSLISAGADCNAPDHHGFTPAHVLSQWNHPSLLHALSQDHRCDIDSPDFNGRSPLIWASYKHFPNCVKVLLLHGASVFRADSDGLTALHWACVTGSADVALMLARAGREQLITSKDGRGLDTIELAIRNNHQGLAMRLGSERRQQRSRANRSYWLAPVLGTEALIAVMMLPSVLSFIPGAVYVIIAGSAAMLLLAHVCASNPGIVRESLPFGSGTQGAIANERLDRVCPTCRIVQPAGSKHCAVLDRCIRRFDHYCPFVGNTVGKLNRRAFVLFVLACVVALALSLIDSCRLLLSEAFDAQTDPESVHADRSIAPTPSTSTSSPVPQEVSASAAARWSRASYLKSRMPQWLLYVYITTDLALLVSVSTLLIAQLVQISQNMTTNEQSNAHRYQHLRRQGQFLNPYDRGWRANCYGFWCKSSDDDGTKSVEFDEPGPADKTPVKLCATHPSLMSASRQTDCRAHGQSDHSRSSLQASSSDSATATAMMASREVQQLPHRLGMVQQVEADDTNADEAGDVHHGSVHRKEDPLESV